MTRSPFDPDVKTWPYWIAGKGPAGVPPQPGDDDPSLKDTTHIAVIDKDGNIFDATPSGGWITGGVVAGSAPAWRCPRAASSSGSTRRGRRNCGRDRGRATR